MNNNKLRLLGLILFALAACLVSFAQTVSGDLAGTVFDASGATIPNATIVARNDATGVETNTKSTGTGEYRIANLPIGTYTITVTSPGFTKAQIRSVTVELNKIATNNVKLDVGANVETVEVSASGATIDTTTAAVQNSFTSTAIADLPITGTSGVINLSLLNAGVGSSGAVGLGTGPSVGGQRPRNNNFTIEGVDNNSGSVTGPLVTIPIDAVSEFSVQQNQVSPEFGHSSGGQFNQVVKSGTNSIHGTAYEYLQNRNFNAADNLSMVNGDPLHPRYDNNRFGGSVGGPIKKNKLFFYGLYEYNPIGNSSSAGQLYAPTAAGWNTIASYSSTPGFSQSNMSQLKQYLGTAGTAASAASVGGYPLVGPGNASLGNQVASSAKPVEVGLLGISSPAFTNNESGVAAIDFNISEKDSLRGRFIVNRQGSIDTAASLPVFYQTVPVNNYLVAISEFHTFTPTITNEFRLGFNRYYNVYSAGDYKWPGLDQFPNVNIFDLNAQLGPDGNAPQGGIQNQYQLTDNVSWVKGKHTLKFGFDGWKQISPQFFTQRSRGDYEWSNLSDYLFDYNPDYIAQRSLGNSEYYGDRLFTGVYVNDTWKATQHLTVNLGLRYEYQTVPYSETLQTRNAISNVPGLLVFQKPTAMKNAWMPRIGLAYSPGTSGKTSIRAGFGRSFDVLVDNFGLLTLPPQATTTVDVTGLDQSGFLAQGGIKPNASSAALSQAEARAGTGGYVPNQVRPESLQWNIGIQHVFHENYTVESRYLGTRGIHLPVQAQLNRVPVVNGANALPFYTSAPSQATLNGLTTSLNGLNAAFAAKADVDPAYLAAGFTGIITSYQPWGNSTYHGWANQVTRRFSNGLQFVAAYTLSHNIDDSTAEVFSTYTTPRRPQDIRNLRADRANSALDHRNRVTFAMLYDTPWYKGSKSWLLKNVVGNWEIAPIYTYQTGNWFTVQSGADSNLNGDSGGDRAYLNAGGNPLIGSGTTPLKNSAGDTVAFLINNPNAGYVTTPKGGLGTAGRNTERLNPTNNFDVSLAKSFNVKENYKFQFAGRFYNVINHPQYVGGYLSDVAPIGFTSTAVHNFTIPNTSVFHNPSQVFSSNPRSITISAKFIF
jgi:hypothetical protein